MARGPKRGATQVVADNDHTRECKGGTRYEQRTGHQVCPRGSANEHQLGCTAHNERSQRKTRRILRDTLDRERPETLGDIARELFGPENGFELDIPPRGKMRVSGFVAFGALRG